MNQTWPQLYTSIPYHSVRQDFQIKIDWFYIRGDRKIEGIEKWTGIDP